MSVKTTGVSFAISLETAQDVAVLKADFPLGKKKKKKKVNASCTIVILSCRRARV